MKQYHFEGNEYTRFRYMVVADDADEARRLIIGRHHIKREAIEDERRLMIDRDSLEITDIKEPTLEPCPMCGSPAELMWVDEDTKNMVHIRCSDINCRAKVDLCVSDFSLERAADWWNTRWWTPILNKQLKDNTDAKEEI